LNPLDDPGEPKAIDDNDGKDSQYNTHPATIHDASSLTVMGLKSLCARLAIPVSTGDVTRQSLLKLVKPTLRTLKAQNKLIMVADYADFHMGYLESVGTRWIGKRGYSKESLGKGDCISVAACVRW